jgi:glutamine synthetase
MGIVDEYGLWSDEQRRLGQEVARQIADRSLEVVRFSFADQHGVLRGKTLLAKDAIDALQSGCSITTTLLAKDTSHRTVFPVFTAGGGFGMREMEGAADVVMVADPATFRILPWAEKTGWLLCDLHFADGRPVPFSTRQILKRALKTLGERGYDYFAGLEVEFHVFKLETARIAPEEAGQPGDPPSVSLLSRGYQYLTEQRYDQIEPALQLIRRGLVELGLPIRSVEVELGPSQCEMTLRPALGIESADMMILFRSAVKQIALRHGYHATFMCRPKIPNVASSGWHLHQSLKEKAGGKNAFASTDQNELLSPLGRNFLAGLVHHARAAALFTTPTVNGYKRYRSYSLAPDRANWGRDNRGVMLRVLGRPGDNATHLENRVGEPAANPYLYMASQIFAGLDGIDRKLEPGPSADAPYESEAPLLSKSLREAVDALRESDFFRAAFGAEFVDYYTRIKTAELERFQAEVSDWEQREYFELF